MNNKIILVLDKQEYRPHEDKYIGVLKKQYADAEIVYTEYEDNAIRKVRNWKMVGSFLQHILYWKKSFHYARKILKSKASTIICINPIVGIFLGMMSRNPDLNIVLCGFLFEPKKSRFYYKMRKKIVIKCLNGIKYAVVYAEQETEYYNSIFPGVNKFLYVPYGIDYLIEYPYQGVLPQKYIFSGGGSNRDYKTLVNAYHLLDEKERLPLNIATMPRCLEGLDVSGINVLTDVVLENFGDVMKRSYFMVLSLKDSELSAGHQVLLQALKDNVVVIVNRIRAIENYVDEKKVVYYKSGDAQDLKKKIGYVIEHYDEIKKNSEHNYVFYRDNYTFDSLLDRLVKLDV